MRPETAPAIASPAAASASQRVGSGLPELDARPVQANRAAAPAKANDSRRVGLDPPQPNPRPGHPYPSSAPANQNAPAKFRRWFNPAVFDFWARHINRTWSAERVLARVIERRAASSRATTLVLKPNRHWPGAIAGQHLDVILDIEGVRHQRSYSLSAPPRADGCIEITVAEVEGGRVSPVLARRARVGDVLELSAPYGGLALPCSGAANITPPGTGCANRGPLHPFPLVGSEGERASAACGSPCSPDPERSEGWQGETGAIREASPFPLSPTSLRSARAPEGVDCHRQSTSALPRFPPGERGSPARESTVPAPVLLLAAGSGITPLRALLLEALAQNDTRAITLAYWAQTGDEICFREELQQLAQRYPNLRVEFLLTRDPQAPAERIHAGQLQALATDLSASDVLACGPDGFIARARELCASARRFQAEGFTAASPQAAEGGTVRVQLARSGLSLDLPTDRPLLQALEEAGQTPVFGCRRGICNTCSCDRISGASRDLQNGALALEPATPIRLCVHSAAQGLVLDL